MDPSSSRPWFGHGKYSSAVWTIWLSLLWLVVNNTVHVSSAFQMSDWSDKIFDARPTPTTTTQGSVFLASTPRHFPSSSFASSSSFPSARNSFWPQSPINSMNTFQLPSSSSSSSSSSFQSSSPSTSTSTMFNTMANHNGFQRHHYSSRFPPLTPAPFMKSRIPMHHFLTNFQQPPTMIRTTPSPAPFDWVRELIQNRLVESRNNLNQVQESLEKIQPLVATTPAPPAPLPSIPMATSTTSTSTTSTTTTTTRRPFRLGQYQVVMDHVPAPPPPPPNPDRESRMIQDHIERLDQIQNNNSNNNNNNENRIDVDYADQIPEVKDENLDYYDHDQNSNSNSNPDNKREPPNNSKQSGQGLETKIQEQKTKLAKQRLDGSNNNNNNQSWIQDSFAQLAKQIKHEMDRSKMEEEEQQQQMEQMEQANNRLDRLMDEEERNRRLKKSLDRRLRPPHNARLEFEHPFLQSLDMDVGVVEQDNDDFNSINHNHNSNSTWSFRCPDNGTGFYADLSDDCQSYYHCSGHRRERFRFTCPYGTRFNERSSNCDWEDNVDCHQKFDLLRA